MSAIKEVSSASRFSPQKMQKINLFETDNFFCDVYCLEPGQQQKPHQHKNEDKIYFVLEGEGTVLLGSEKHPISADEICLAQAGEEHGIENTGSTRMRVLVFMTPNPNRKT